jgi:hypothetical protein
MQIGQFDLTILVIIVFGVLVGLAYGSVSLKAGLAVATPPSPHRHRHIAIATSPSLHRRHH